MKKPNRDLLVLLNQDLMTPATMQHAIDFLNGLLFDIERLDNFVTAHELIDLNRYKIYKSDFEIKKFVRTKGEKPFQFLFPLN
jgi:hypothetical protein